MRIVSDKSCSENQNNLYSIIFFTEIIVSCEIMWENMAEADRHIWQCIAAQTRYDFHVE